MKLSEIVLTMKRKELTEEQKVGTAWPSEI